MFTENDIVRIYPEYLESYEDPKQDYIVLEDREDRLLVKVEDEKSVFGGYTYVWPIHMFYKVGHLEGDKKVYDNNLTEDTDPDTANSAQPAEKYYYAQPINSEIFDWENYYNDDYAEADKFWAGGNRDFSEINSDLVADIRRKLDNAEYDLGAIDEDEDDEEKVAKDIIEIISYYFPKEKGSLTNEDINTLFLKLDRYINGSFDSSDDELDLICDILEIEYGEPFEHEQIHGYSQSDWMDCVYPKSISNKIPYIEAVLMGTGTEYAITTDKVDPPENILDEDVYYDYTEKWKEADVIDWLAHNIGCNKDEIKLLDD